MTGCTTGTAAPRETFGPREPAPISSFLVKVASRCNLACDYCYVYFHADQSWRSQPKVMSPEIRRRLADRIAEYARESGRERLSVVFHGGEPLLAGAGNIVETAEWIRAAAEPTHVDFSLQTNGVLLDDDVLDQFVTADIGVSLSIDGPREAHDRHRLTAGGRSSFDQVLAALERLRERPAIFAGVIAVVDLEVQPSSLFEFFAAHSPPQLDFLLPDANFLRPPPGRGDNPSAYETWLIEAFDVWFDLYPQIRVRTFDTILDGLAGLPSGTDAFGYGDVSLLSVETDGTYHDLDVLKVTEPGATVLEGGVADTTVMEAARSERLDAHRQLLRHAGLARACQECPEVAICGGGAVPHRFDENGFENPTVYCREMFGLIRHARRRVVERLEGDRTKARVKRRRSARFNLVEFEEAECGADLIRQLLDKWGVDAAPAFEQALRIAVSFGGSEDAIDRILKRDPRDVRALATQPAVVAWSEVMTRSANGRRILSLSGKPLAPDPDYVEALSDNAEALVAHGLRIHRDDKWLRAPFEDHRLTFHGPDDAARRLADDALELVREWRPALYDEMDALSREVLFIRDLTAHPDKCVSFSDDSIPGALYCSIERSSGLVSAADLADSLIHEHRHQKLYLLNRDVDLVDSDHPLLVSPWRDDPRPPSGLLHALFVFVELLGFWTHRTEMSSAGERERAEAEVRLIRERLMQGFETIRGAALTPAGGDLVAALEVRAGLGA